MRQEWTIWVNFGQIWCVLLQERKGFGETIGKGLRCIELAGYERPLAI